LTPTFSHGEDGMKATLKLGLGITVLMLITSIAASALAAPVVVGSVNPDTKQVTIFNDLLVREFQDGTPISRIYGGFKEITNDFIMVRAGKSHSRVCQTDTFRLVRISGNRLAIAANEFGRVAWNGIDDVPTLKRCFSETCSGFCQVLGDPSTSHATDYQCQCSSANGFCESGLNALHKLEDILVVQQWNP